jgi:hypothetical protein
MYEPWNPGCYAWLGVALMNIPERIAEALGAFELAMRSGGVGEELIVHAFACAFLLQDEDKLDDAARIAQGSYRDLAPRARGDKRWEKRYQGENGRAPLVLGIDWQARLAEKPL